MYAAKTVLDQAMQLGRIVLHDRHIQQGAKVRLLRCH